MEDGVEIVMNSRIAKALRRKAYGKKNFRDRKYRMGANPIMKGGKRIQSTFYGRIEADPLRRAYQKSKREYYQKRRGGL